MSYPYIAFAEMSYFMSQFAYYRTYVDAHLWFATKKSGTWVTSILETTSINYEDSFRVEPVGTHYDSISICNDGPTFSVICRTWGPWEEERWWSWISDDEGETWTKHELISAMPGTAYFVVGGQFILADQSISSITIHASTDLLVWEDNTIAMPLGYSLYTNTLILGSGEQMQALLEGPSGIYHVIMSPDSIEIPALVMPFPANWHTATIHTVRLFSVGGTLIVIARADSCLYIATSQDMGTTWAAPTAVDLATLLGAGDAASLSAAPYFDVLVDGSTMTVGVSYAVTGASPYEEFAMHKIVCHDLSQPTWSYAGSTYPLDGPSFRDTKHIIEPDLLEGWMLTFDSYYHYEYSGNTLMSFRREIGEFTLGPDTYGVIAAASPHGEVYHDPVDWSTIDATRRYAGARIDTYMGSFAANCYRESSGAGFAYLF